ncbi:MAG: DUF433 domain-containing protein [Dehalococcoidia bacterium]
MEAVLTQHIVMTPGTCGGKPRIAGTRIRVLDVVIYHERLGEPVSAILEAFPHITAADVHAALAFYHDNRELIDEQIEAGRRAEADYRAKFPDRAWPKLDG